MLPNPGRRPPRPQPPRPERRPEVVFQPVVRRGIRSGTDKLASVLAPSFGPLPRSVAIIHRYDRNRAEVLDSGGEIIRQILQLGDRTEDVGAMFLRECLWRQHQQFDDGATTAAIIFQSVLSEGARYIAAGGNAMQLRRYLNTGIEAIIDALTGQTAELTGCAQMSALAHTISHDEELSRMLGSILDDIGEFGRLEIRAGNTRDLVRERVEGMYWERGLISRQMATEKREQRTDWVDAAVLISDLEIDDVRQLLPALAVAIEAGIARLFIVAQKLSDSVIAFLLGNSNPDRFQIAAVTTPGYGLDQVGELQDLAVATGGKAFIKAAGDTFEYVRPEHFGRARRLWADVHNFGVIEGGGDPAALQAHLLDLFSAFEKAEDPVLHEKLRKRIAKLQGGSATLWVGGPEPELIKKRTALAERTVKLLREAMMYGVLPGGGVALLGCQPALRELRKDSIESDERAAYEILLRALEQPFRTIAANAGADPHVALARVHAAGPGYGLDAISGEIALMVEAGIVDSATVLKSAVFNAISSAALALTVDVMVLHRSSAGQPAPGEVRGLAPGPAKRL